MTQRRPSLDSTATHESFAARLGGKFRDAITPHLHHDDDGEQRGRSFLTKGKQGNPERSDSRGRDPIVSTGRGGAGNLRASSRTRSAYDNDDDDRGRSTRSAHPPPPKAVHAGRGGVGNVRSPSRDPADLRNQQAEQQLEAKLQREAHEKAERDGMLPTGRGGAGNIRAGGDQPPTSSATSSTPSRSRSRSRTRDLLQRATSRDRSTSRDVAYNHSSSHVNVGGGGNSFGNVASSPAHPNTHSPHDIDGDTSLAAVRE
ncbi:hypothetical protein E3P77_01690 [Wallemia ichthyophaga]|uniref:Uncharacterized protein n=2 Tax=Wallemia ichthyophaga TaxID=245174 RepID=A0A4V4MDC2_WALIC|nr:uncharacterized protein J056_003565 [Wallemia ichthyophaga EXF-994]TIA72393.1 hypothetical protein E3P91_02062 [Wallemia ichthyophaga]EOR01889.1 hypothetical protein J056_003565 [Wallemia ichthyophaga EXF-994]TIA81783.1 hypothetical protein E3P98_01866 [Wallemia ichthyophaga]TIB00261.1 hypothetical protein E3P95_01801 [Wallemia ichthyophaga]TIB01444.1 hypothetical protein E3P94_01783 [Wallemia ichthyophaga]